MTIGRGLLIALVVLLVATTVVRLAGLDRGFLLTAAMVVYPYVVLAALPLTGLAAGLRWWPETVASGACLAVGLAVVVPRTLPGPMPASPATGAALTVAVVNLREGGADAVAVMEGVEDADVDVLVVLELTEASVQALAAAGLDDLLPEAVVLPSRFTSGGGIWSRHLLAAREPSRLRGFGVTPRATIDVPGHGPLELDAVHPLPPITSEWTTAWERALSGLPPPATGASGPRRMLAGDFNATLDHRRFRDLLDQGWVDAADARGAGLRPTFGGLGSGEPVPPVTLDHVLVDREVAVEHVATRPLPGSDHRMLVTHLRLPRG